MYAILAFIPIIVTVVLMVAFNWPAKRALPLAWVLAAIIGVAVWKMSIGAVALQTVIGFLEAFAVLVIIFGAILIMNTLSSSGAMVSLLMLVSRLLSLVSFSVHSSKVLPVSVHLLPLLLHC